MVKVVPVDKERHRGKGWRRPMGYSFISNDLVVPVGGSEFPYAVLAMPIGFIEQSGHYVPVALMGLSQGKNVFVGPAGQWLGSYVPAVVRSYPFSLSREDGQEGTLCFDEDSGLVA